MISKLEAYLITRGDHVHSTLFWILIILAIAATGCLIGALVFTRFLDDNNDADEDDMKMAKFWSRWGLNTLIIFFIILITKTFIPTSEDIVVMFGLREITHEHLLNTAPVTAAVLEKRFPDITTRDEYWTDKMERQQQEFQKTRNYLDSLQKVVDRY